MMDNVIPIVIGEVMRLSSETLAIDLRMYINSYTRNDYRQAIDDIITIAMIGNYYDVYAFAEAKGQDGAVAIKVKVLINRDPAKALALVASYTRRSMRTIKKYCKEKGYYIKK